MNLISLTFHLARRATISRQWKLNFSCHFLSQLAACCAIATRWLGSCAFVTQSAWVRRACPMHCSTFSRPCVKVGHFMLSHLVVSALKLARPSELAFEYNFEMYEFFAPIKAATSNRLLAGWLAIHCLPLTPGSQPAGLC